MDRHRRRWGIEVFFRTFKQTFDKGKLKCTGSVNVTLELEWSLIGLWVMCLYGKEEIGKRYEVSQLILPTFCPKRDIQIHHSTLQTTAVTA